MKFSDVAMSLKASEIRELLKLTTMPEIISFAGGLPAPELFPIEDMEKVDVEILRKEGRQAVQYGTTEGYNPLREKIAKRMKSAFDIDCTFEDLIVTAGSQQGLSLLGQIFLNKDDIVLVESPTYLGAINAFKLNFPKFIEVPTDDKGIVPEALEKILAENDRVRLMYVIPEFQNPTGITWPLERRKAVMDIFMPGFRIGWMVANPEVIDKVVKLKQAVDLQTSSFGQRQAAYYMDMFDLDKHVATIRKLYGERRTLMYDCMKKYFPEGVTFTYPEGGLFTWVTLPEGMDAKELMPKVLDRQVAYVPGGPFYPNGGNANHFRLNYSNMPPERIEEGIKRLGEVLHSELGK